MSTSDKDVEVKADQIRLTNCQGEAFRASRKLKAWGILLQRQGEAGKGFEEPEGLGMALSDLGDELEALSHQLDSINFKKSKLCAVTSADV